MRKTLNDNGTLHLPPGVHRSKKVKALTQKVTLTMGRTVNLGNYESLRMEISAESGVGEHGALDVLDSLEKAVVKDLDERIKRNVAALKG